MLSPANARRRDLCLRVILGVFICVLAPSPAHAREAPRSFGITHEREPEVFATAVFDWCVTRASAARNFSSEQMKARALIARLSLEDGGGAQYAAAAAFKAGFSGVVLDAGDGVKPDAFAEMFREIKKSAPGKLLVARAPSSFAARMVDGADAWLVEGADAEALLADIRVLRAAKADLVILANAFLPPERASDAAPLAERLRVAGALPCVTTPERDGHFFAPLASVPRRLLCLHGDAEDASRPWFPADTATAALLQTPLEWLGYEVDYLMPGEKTALPEVLPGRYAAVVVDGSMRAPVRRERALVDWLLRQKERGVKLVFLGQYPLEQDGERARLMRALGIGGSGAPANAALGVTLTVNPSGAMSADVTVRAQRGDIADVRAPSGAVADLSFEGRDAAANVVRYDPVFTAPWGGVLLDPYFTFQASASDVRHVCDPFLWLARIFPPGAFPAPDPSTRDGRRVFYFQIDGDGFMARCQFDARRICGEVMTDEILKKHALPVTCSVIEAEMRAHKIDQKPGEEARAVKAARAMFALPNVHAASHSYSHPFVWIDNDVEYLPQYPRRNLELRAEAAAAYPTITAEREVAGSIEYIEKNLLPPGRKVEIMLWSGGCRPSPEALDVCARLGVENMNGGGATISGRHPSTANVPPRAMTWDGRLQINSSMQNEYVFTRDWNGPFFGGFRQVIDTFERTETPRRLAPVDVYCHFYSAQHLSALRALKDILVWCDERPLHPLTAREYARIVRDSRETVVFRTGDGGWIVSNAGQLRTLRLPSGGASPALERCEGVTGFKEEPRFLYVHTSGAGLTRLHLENQTARAKPRPRLIDSTAEVDFTILDMNRIAGTTHDMRESVRLTFGGIEPGLAVTCIAAGTRQILNADAQGTISLSLPGSGAFTIQF